MKTTYILITALFLILSTSAFAADDKKSNAAERSLSAPEFVWGNPDGLDQQELSKMDRKAALSLPSFNWGAPDEIDLEEIDIVSPTLTFALPEFVWGNPDDSLLQEAVIN
ncbi:hypothetical protein [Hufsiella ginkgonis]|uniref:Uncharacterized protein n=1 Tax=Hufsiella ginkgonis TaxID=2695274 RepID=A0A7K1Y3J1_9SPHI|nr:hypothetical protein [Hufsiella ginkgonis]MXV17678.1 hypothetical protein [Hufsiella ginkgonis]